MVDNFMDSVSSCLMKSDYIDFRKKNRYLIHMTYVDVYSMSSQVSLGSFFREWYIFCL